jgi:hypothetical protein
VVWHSRLIQAPEDKLDQICELSGGVEIQTEQSFEAWRLKEFTQMVRERYTLEYPRGRSSLSRGLVAERRSLHSSLRRVGAGCERRRDQGD